MSMRIIAGTARGRKIFTTPTDIMVRPISARIRQQLFDIVRPRITAAYFLDLFAGTGAVGLEALSRGAQKVAFVEKDMRCIKVIEKNLAHLDFAKQASVLRGDATNALTWVLHKTGVESFDLIFLGPPYRLADNTPLFLARSTLLHIAQGGLLSTDGWIMAQHHQKEEPGAVPGLEMFRREKHGDSRVSFYRRAPAA
ncbi:MAG: 16S rRNA (guanine(966)-N(2))-methyltransferase RsmD [Elusimicrobia bacterium]|nr:16S rRNA (guanine(966)-N(2))-methyltransferase RsmD [Elusimicrobiota bacterium]